MSVDVGPNWLEDKNMRTDALCLLLAVRSLAACSSGPARVVQVTLSGATFATTGGNLFNCGSPAQPATPQLLGDQTISCFLAANGNGYTSAPSSSLCACADPNDMCTTSDACAFNQFTATVTVQNVAE